MNANDINTAAAETATAATTEAAAQTSAAGAGGAEGVFPKAESVEDAMFSDLKQRAGFTEEKKTKEKNEHTSLFSNNNTYGQTAALMGRTFVFGCAMGAGTVAGTYLATKAIQMLTDRFGNNEAPASE